MSGFVYDAAVLVAADRNERQSWAEHKARLELGVVPLVPAPVAAQVSRSLQQAQLRRFLAGCSVVPMGENEAHEAGRLLAMALCATTCPSCEPRPWWKRCRIRGGTGSHRKATRSAWCS